MVVQRRDEIVSDRLEAVLRVWNDFSSADWVWMCCFAHLKSLRLSDSQTCENLEGDISLGAELLADEAIAQVKGYCTAEDMIRGELGLGADFSF